MYFLHSTCAAEASLVLHAFALTLLSCSELCRHIIQIPGALLHGLRHTILRYVPLSSNPSSSPPTPAASLIPLPQDLFWSFTDSAYNTIFKLLFIASSAYTIYLMLNDYKPTHDPNIDTFKVQYLIAGSAVLAILFPYQYTPAEVR